MEWQFHELKDIPRFARYLAMELQKQGVSEWADKAKVFDHVWVLPATEYLGEFRILLNDLVNEEPQLPESIQSNVRSAIQWVDRAFGCY